MTSTFKIVLIGDGGVGKTTYIRRLLGDDFKMPYTATFGAEVHPIVLSAPHNGVVFNVWDTSGQHKFSGMRDPHYEDADAAIVMFDVDSRISYENVQWWCDEIRAVNPEIPIVIVGNKCDIVGRCKVNSGYYFEISAKLKTDLEKPLDYIAGILTA